MQSFTLRLPAAEFTTPQHERVSRRCVSTDSPAAGAAGAAAAAAGGPGDPAPPEGGRAGGGEEPALQ